MVSRVIARATTPEMEALEEVEIDLKPAERLISGTAWRQIRKAFPRKVWPWFRFYRDLMTYFLGAPLPEYPLDGYFKRQTNFLVQSGLSPTSVNQLASSRTYLMGKLRDIQRDPTQTAAYKRVLETLVPILLSVTKDKGVYLKTRAMGGGKGGVRWMSLWKMRAPEQAAEQLKDEDPRTYELLMDKKQSLKQIDSAIKAKIKRAGLIHKTALLGGSIPVQIGVDPITGEQLIYDRDGDVLPRDEFIEKLKARRAEQEKLIKFASRTQLGKGAQDIIAEDLRSQSDEEIDAIDSPIEYAAMTDDKAKRARVTRLFPVKKKPQGWIARPDGTMERDHVNVIAEGRYKGFYLDDMVNASGRLIEGAAYRYQPRRGKTETVPERVDPANREPYVTVADVTTERTFRGKKVKQKKRKLFVKIGSANTQKELRNALKKLACNHTSSGVTGCIESIVWRKIEGSRAAAFEFEAKDFATIMENLQGMSLSEGALKFVKDYYEDLSRAEQATDEANLANYTMETLGGFKDPHHRLKDEEGNPATLNAAQKKALAWLDANGNQGVCALETGVGKTLTAIATMQKFVRDGMTDEGASYTVPGQKEPVYTNGRFLFVCPKALKGGPRKEADAFLTGEAAAALKDRLDIISYSEFSGSSRSKNVPRSLKSNPYWSAQISAAKSRGKRAMPVPPPPPKGPRKKRKKGPKVWHPEQYVSVFFDEAHLLMSRTVEKGLQRYRSGAAQAALDLYHPHKVALTASPMEKSPMDTYFLAAITGNKPLNTKSIEGRDNLKEMRRFKQRFCETLGGRIVGVQDDPVVKRDLGVWVKRNIYHADKTGPEFNLPALHAETEGLEMSPVVQAVYKGMTKQFSSVMRAFTLKFRDLGVPPPRVVTDPETGEIIDRIPSKLTKQQERDMAAAEEMFKRKFRPVMGMMTDLANKPDVALARLARIIQTGKMPNGKPLDKIAEDPDLKGFIKFIKAMAKRFSPEDLRAHAKSVGNPKLDRATSIIKEKAEQTEGTRTLLFSDDEDLVMRSALRLSKQMPGIHVAALDKSIHLIRNGKELTELRVRIPRRVLEGIVKDPAKRALIERQTDNIVVFDLPFVQRRYRLYPAPVPGNKKLNKTFDKADWQQFVFKQIVAPSAKYKSASLFGKAYAYGLNLQAFDTVIHLDRDSWNSESMKQRTARAWRQGQDKPVDEVTLDSVYRSTDRGKPVHGDLDKTLDEIKGFFQQVEGDLFDAIIRGSQGTKLGEEWLGMDKQKASLTRLDQKVLELALSPYAKHSLPPRAT
jgi:hypothetical protein